MTTNEKDERTEKQAEEPETPSTDVEAADESGDDTQPRPYADIVDDTLDDSFPASDPPAWAGS